jgi:hypothetical protein
MLRRTGIAAPEKRAQGYFLVFGPRIELAGDAVDAWKLVSPFVSEEIL